MSLLRAIKNDTVTPRTSHAKSSPPKTAPANQLQAHQKHQRSLLIKSSDEDLNNPHPQVDIETVAMHQTFLSPDTSCVKPIQVHDASVSQVLPKMNGYYNCSIHHSSVNSFTHDNITVDVTTNECDMPPHLHIHGTSIISNLCDENGAPSFHRDKIFQSRNLPDAHVQELRNLHPIHHMKPFNNVPNHHHHHQDKIGYVAMHQTISSQFTYFVNFSVLQVLTAMNEYGKCSKHSPEHKASFNTYSSSNFSKISNPTFVKESVTTKSLQIISW